METIYWVYIFGGVGLFSLLAFVLFYVKDLEIKRKMRLTNKFMRPNWLFLLVFVAAIGCSIILYMDIQNQATALFN